jgi:hypothetical protein
MCYNRTDEIPFPPFQHLSNSISKPQLIRFGFFIHFFYSKIRHKKTAPDRRRHLINCLDLTYGVNQTRKLSETHTVSPPRL